MSKFKYSDADRETIHRVIYERRDMRHLVPDAVEPLVLKRILNAAHKAPSVGLMQPWRFICITDEGLREKLYACVKTVSSKTADTLGLFV